MKVLLGILIAGIGAVFGYIGANIMRSRERQAKRKILLAMLKYELRRVKDTFPAYQRGQVFHRDPLRFASLGELVHGDALSYKKDGKLLRKLLLFRVGVTRYNDFISVTNLIQNFATMPDEVHKEVFDQIAEHHRLVRELKAQVHAAFPANISEVGDLNG